MTLPWLTQVWLEKSGWWSRRWPMDCFTWRKKLGSNTRPERTRPRSGPFKVRNRAMTVMKRRCAHSEAVHMKGGNSLPSRMLNDPGNGRWPARMEYNNLATEDIYQITNRIILLQIQNLINNNQRRFACIDGSGLKEWVLTWNKGNTPETCSLVTQLEVGCFQEAFGDGEFCAVT